MNPADDFLMRKVREGDVDKLAVLFERHHKALFHFFVHMAGGRETAEDLTQDVFFRMLKYRHTYAPEGRFASWMYQIARNAYLDFRRKQGNEAQWPDDENGRELEPVDPEPAADARVERSQDVAVLRQALAALPPEKREILVLSRFQNLKYDEIAEILRCDVGAVKVRVFRAVRQLSGLFFEIRSRRAS